MSSGGGTKVVQQPTSTTSSSNPWAGQQPYLTTGFEQAQQNVLNRPTTYFPGNTVVPFSQQTETGLQRQEDRALAGSPVVGAAQQNALGTLQGDYLSAGNPYFGAMTDRIDAAIRPKVQSAFEGAGRSQGAGVQEAYTRAMADAVAPLAFQNYSAERGRQQEAAQFAPSLAQADYQDIGQLLGVGTTREALDRENIADQMARHTFGEQEPTNRLAQYMGLIQGNYGGTTTTQGTTPYFQQSSNPLLTGLGALTAGAQLAGSFGGFCWVARAVYGADDPRWLEFRDWITGYAPRWLFRLYGRYGPRFAKVVERHPWSKRLLRPLMDRARKEVAHG